MAFQNCRMMKLHVVICVFIFMNTLIRADSDLVNITLVDDAVQRGAVCLDGSPAGYHHAEGFGEGADNWLIFLPGGGWCGQESTCLERSKGSSGSTINITSTNWFSGILSSNQTLNPEFFSWNRVLVRYCDGSSFMGDAEDPEKKLHLRGARIFTAVVHDVLSKGMEAANNVILAGTSAGGLATILNCDRFRALVPNAHRVKCISDSGFFILGKNIPGAEGRVSSFAKIVNFHGIAKSLPTSCTSRINASLCFFPENVVGDIQTPLFLLNSAFDYYQLRQTVAPKGSDETGWKANCTVQTPTLLNCSYSQFQIVKEFRTTFLETLKETDDSQSRGEFINSCYIHDFLNRENYWNGNPSAGNKTIVQAISDWYFDRSPVKEIDDTQKDQIPLTCSALPCC